MTIEKAWDLLVQSGTATEDELQLVVAINGYSIESLNDVLYVRTGYRDVNDIEHTLYGEYRA